MSGADHYEVLNVERTATTDEIKSAYRRLVRQVHPDQGGNAALFRLVQEAWTTLSDPYKRAAYDRKLSGSATAEPEPDTSYAEQTRPRSDPGTDNPPTEAAPGGSNGPPAEPARSGSIRVVPRFGRWRRLALVALAVWLVLAAGPYVYSSLQEGWSAPIGLLLAALTVIGLPPHWRRRLPLHRRITGCGIVGAFGLAVMALPFVSTSLPNILRAWIFIVVAGIVVVRVLTARWSAARELDVAIDRGAAYDANVWGRPGEPLVDDGYSAPIPGSAVLRHRRTARMLEDVVVRLPAAKLIHGARVGGLTVDHLMIAGDRVAVVASMIGPSGTYTLDLYGSVLRDGQPFDGGDPGLAAAVAAWQARLKGFTVRGFLIIHPAVEGQGQITVATGSGAAVTCLAARSAAAELTDWLRPEGDVLNRWLLYDVLYQAPLGLR
ncbi:J domain-containing protein [Kribbella sp. NPDC023972]|uniref:J domain-containing protein n=1 Tax=Kribbella sp. NPDC023972 TaxID=3154795 RepID=UPI0033E637ED